MNTPSAVFANTAAWASTDIGVCAPRLTSAQPSSASTQAAISELQRMPSLFAGYPEWVARSLLEQARAHRQIGQTGEANQLYEQVIREYSGTPFARTAGDEQEAL